MTLGLNGLALQVLAAAATECQNEFQAHMAGRLTSAHAAQSAQSSLAVFVSDLVAGGVQQLALLTGCACFTACHGCGATRTLISSALFAETAVTGQSMLTLGMLHQQHARCPSCLAHAPVLRQGMVPESVAQRAQSHGRNAVCRQYAQPGSAPVHVPAVWSKDAS